MITITSHNQLYPGMTEEDKSCFFRFWAYRAHVQGHLAKNHFQRLKIIQCKSRKIFQTPNQKQKSINQFLKWIFILMVGKKQIVNNKNKTKHVHEMNTHTVSPVQRKKIVPGTTNNKAIYWGYHGFAFSLTVFH